jgi:hypothetical protein
MDNDKFQRAVLAGVASLQAATEGLAASVKGVSKQVGALSTAPAAPATTQPAEPAASPWRNGMGFPDGNLFVQSETAERLRKLDPEWPSYKRLCVRDALVAFPELVAGVPVQNGVNLVRFNCDRAGFDNNLTHDFDGKWLSEVASAYGNRYDTINEKGDLTPGWETEILRAWGVYLEQKKRAGATPGVDFSPDGK